MFELHLDFLKTWLRADEKASRWEPEDGNQSADENAIAEVILY